MRYLRLIWLIFNFILQDIELLINQKKRISNKETLIKIKINELKLLSLKISLTRFIVKKFSNSNINNYIKNL